MYYQNVRGLRSKTKDFLLASTACNYDVIALSETWLVPAIYDSELFGPDFIVYRCDRSPLNSTRERGGGVLLAVRSEISSERIVVPNTDTVEIVSVRLNLNCKIIYIVCLYIPSGSADIVYCSYVEAITLFFCYVNVKDNDTVLIVGDFNMPSVDWINDDSNKRVLLPTSFGSAIETSMLSALFSFDLCQLNNVVNFQGRLLDLLFSTNRDDVTVIKSVVPLSRVDAYHVPIEVKIDMDAGSIARPSPPAMVFDFKKANFEALSKHILSTDWDIMFKSYTKVGEAVDFFYAVIIQGFNLFVPKKTVRHTSRPVWFNRSLLKLKNLKTKAWYRYKRTNSAEDFSEYCKLRSRFASSQRSLYDDYLRKTQSDLTSDPTKFWAYVDTKKKTRVFHLL